MASVLSRDSAVVALFDGHGGADVAQHCRSMLTRRAGQLSSEADVASLFRDMQATAESELGEATFRDQGTTATVLLLKADASVIVANVGDSLAFMFDGDGATALTTDDRTDNNPGEVERVRDAGGLVFKLCRHENACLRVNGDLNMTRSIGDGRLLPFVSCEPHVATFPKPMIESGVIVVASDGLWDHVEVETVHAIVRSGAPAAELPMRLIAAAYAQGSDDNISVLLGVPPPNPPAGGDAPPVPLGLARDPI